MGAIREIYGGGWHQRRPPSDKRNLHIRVIIDLLSAQLDHLCRLPKDGHDLVLGLAQLKRFGRRRRRVGRWRWWWWDRRHRLLWRGFLSRRRRPCIFGCVVVGLHRQHFSDVLQLFIGWRDGMFLEGKLKLPIVANILVWITVNDNDDAVGAP